jgi:hypothetical protein
MKNLLKDLLGILTERKLVRTRAGHKLATLLGLGLVRTNKPISNSRRERMIRFLGEL